MMNNRFRTQYQLGAISVVDVAKQTESSNSSGNQQPKVWECSSKTYADIICAALNAAEKQNEKV